MTGVGQLREQAPVLRALAASFDVASIGDELLDLAKHRADTARSVRGRISRRLCEIGAPCRNSPKITANARVADVAEEAVKMVRVHPVAPHHQLNHGIAQYVPQPRLALQPTSHDCLHQHRVLLSDVTARSVAEV
ncbi:MAG TPA: hypothetical protein VGZ72_05520 [Stellaceae bacterium]|nr:hypothetical protein [Stellaceae bacterium]